MKSRNTVLDCLYLFNKSEDHRLYTLVEFNNYCLFPLIHKKARLFYDGDQPVGFVSWAWLTAEEADEFLSERWMPDEAVWKRPDSVDGMYHLWGMDFIAPFGNALTVMRGMRKHSKHLYGTNVPVHWRRFKQPDKVHTKEF